MKSRFLMFLESIKVLSMPDISIVGMIEMFFLFFIIYKIVKAIRPTRAWVVLKGVIFILMFYLIADVLNFYVLTAIIKSLSGVALMSIVIIFNNDIRKVFEKIGQKDFISMFKKNRDKKSEKVMYISEDSIDVIIDAVGDMSKTSTGALIVFQREAILDEYSNTGIILDSKISEQLLNNIFYDKTPLHDGAMILKDDQIHAATCYLPLSKNPSIDKGLGTRHRAAIGITEVSDAVVVIVSEETGAISYAKKGEIYFNVKIDHLRNQLNKDLQIKEERKKISLSSIFKDNLIDKILAIGLSFFVWFSYMNILSPPITKIIESVPYEVVNEEYIEKKGKTYDSNIDDDVVDVSITGEASKVNSLKRSDIQAVVDLSKISISNAAEVEVKIPRYPELTAKIPAGNMVHLEIDDLISSEWEVEAVEEKSPKGNLVFEKVIFDNDISTVKISGPKNKIEKIGKVFIGLDLTDVADGDNFSKEITIIDKNGEKMNKNIFKIDKPVSSGVIEMNDSKEIPLNIEFTDMEKSSVWIKEVNYDPDKIIIAGDREDLDKMNTLDISLSLSNLETDKNTRKIIKNISLNDYVPKGVKVPASKNLVKITIRIEPPVEKVINIKNKDMHLKDGQDVNIKNLDDTQEYKFVGPEKLLNEMNLSEHNLFYQAPKDNPGAQHWEIKFIGDPRIELKSQNTIRIENRE